MNTSCRQLRDLQRLHASCGARLMQVEVRTMRFWPDVTPPAVPQTSALPRHYDRSVLVGQITSVRHTPAMYAHRLLCVPLLLLAAMLVVHEVAAQPSEVARLTLLTDAAATTGAVCVSSIQLHRTRRHSEHTRRHCLRLPHGLLGPTRTPCLARRPSSTARRPRTTSAAARRRTSSTSTRRAAGTASRTRTARRGRRRTSAAARGTLQRRV